MSVETSETRLRVRAMRVFSPSRLAAYAIGVPVLSAGIVVTIRADLGVSPVNSVPFVLSQTSAWSLGVASFAIYGLQVALQALVLWRRTTWKVPLQLVGAFAFAWAIGTFDTVIPERTGSGWLTSAVLLAVGIALTALGTTLVIRSNLLVAPPDGVVQAVSIRTSWEFGIVKIVHDCAMVAIALVIGLIAGQAGVGIGVGTLISALLVGYAIRHFARGFDALTGRNDPR
ncbi:hypothetical protein RN607_13610 [Demequina capsici]|uniref:Membrane protein YczE n=1 Tax=Demequina capsici TaxID=3075620 RepID=A0AA96J9F1_9MICO|nr:hypothetical protein [Demequina sp. PMTSA13]WNM27222.1 hypothetical protein RN607_13610 [Demequina sp. PMTSA13]